MEIGVDGAQPIEFSSVGIAGLAFFSEALQLVTQIRDFFLQVFVGLNLCVGDCKVLLQLTDSL